MALVTNGVKISLGTALVPSGYAPTTALSEFSDHTYVRSLSLTVDKVTVDDSDKATTFKAIIENATVGIQKQVDDILGAEFDDTAKTVTSWIDLLSIGNNQGVSKVSDFYTDSLVDYKVSIKLYIKVA